MGPRGPPGHFPQQRPERPRGNRGVGLLEAGDASLRRAWAVGLQASPLATCPAEARRLRLARSIRMRTLFRGVKDCRVCVNPLAGCTQRNSLTENISNANDTVFLFFANIADYLSQSRIMANMMTRQEALTLEPNLLPMMMLMVMMTMTMTTATTTTKVA